MPKPLAETAQIMECSELDLIFVESIVRYSKTSFMAGMKILSPERRYAIYALYSFCRIVDDIADGTESEEIKQTQLQGWRDKIEELYLGKVEGSLEKVLKGSIYKFNLKKEDFLAIIDGMEMDIAHPIVGPDEATLDLYCDRVAAAVGRLAVRIFGETSQSAEKVAYHLGRALQLTNIVRDLYEDAKRGRIYLPKELLNRFQIPLDPKEIVHHRLLQEVCTIIAYRAGDHFKQAKKHMVLCDGKAMRPAKIMALTYYFLLTKQKRLGWKQPLQRASLSFVEKLIVGIAGLMV